MNFCRIVLYFFGLVSLVCCGSHGEKSVAGKEETVTLTSQSLSSTLFYSGTIQPLKTVVITTPAEGVIEEMFFHYGDYVKAGAVLFTISSEKFQTDYKTALMQYIKSKNEFNTANSQLIQSTFLHKNQLISDDEFNTKKNAFYNAQLSLVQANEALSAMLKQLNLKGFNINELTIENIGKITQALSDQGDSQKLCVVAPVSGVALLPTKSDNESETKKVGKGDQVKQSDVLAVIGDTTGLIIHVSVNEFNINELKVGQKVKVTGAAFPNIILQGNISGVDRQAQVSSGSMPAFPIEVVIPKLTTKEQEIIHVGMSAKVEIAIEGSPQLLIPIAAVIEKNGQTFVNAKDAKSGKLREVAIKTGQTTAEGVVVDAGLKAGDQVVFTR